MENFQDYLDCIENDYNLVLAHSTDDVFTKTNTGCDLLIHELLSFLQIRPFCIDLIHNLIEELYSKASERNSFNLLPEKIIHYIFRKIKTCKQANLREIIPSIRLLSYLTKSNLINSDLIISNLKNYTFNEFPGAITILRFFLAPIVTNCSHKLDNILQINEDLTISENPEIWCLWVKFHDFHRDDWDTIISSATHGCNDDSLEYFLMKDDLENFQNITSVKPDFDFNQKVQLPVFFYFPLPEKKASLIEIAAFYGSINCFKFLYNNIKIEGKIGFYSVIDYAVAGGNLEIVRICMQNGLEPANSLSFAISFRRNNIFEFLLSSYTDIDINKVAIECAEKNFIYGLRYLQESDIDYSQTLLPISAIKNWNFYLLKTLEIPFDQISLSEIVRAKCLFAIDLAPTHGYTEAFFIAIDNMDWQIIEKLLHFDQKNLNEIFDCETILYHAVETKNISLVNMLAKNGVDPNIISPKTNMTALQRAAQLTQQMTKAVLRIPGCDPFLGDPQKLAFNAGNKSAAFAIRDHIKRMKSND